MKRTNLLLVLIVAIVLFYTLISLHKKRTLTALEEHYLENEKRYESFESIYGLELFHSFYENNLECPKTFELEPNETADENVSSGYIWGVDIRKDIFFEEDAYYYYVPFYDSISKKREGFVFLSSGLDGIIDNPFTWKDSIFKEDLNASLKLYNQVDFRSEFYSLDSTEFKEFDGVIWKGRDILVMYMDCFSYFVNLPRGIVNAEQFPVLFEKKRFREHSFFGLELNNFSICKDSLFANYGDIRIHANLKVNKLEGYKCSTVVGEIEKVNYQKRIMILRNAAVYSSSDTTRGE